MGGWIGDEGGPEQTEPIGRRTRENELEKDTGDDAETGFGMCVGVA